jgi:NADP-reducing hydrogenase subunit HndD
MGESTGAGVIFGTTGGVIEAAVRTAYELHTGKELDREDFKELRGMEGIRSATLDFDGLPINIGIAHGLGNARKLLEDIKLNPQRYAHFSVFGRNPKRNVYVDPDSLKKK